MIKFLDQQHSASQDLHHEIFGSVLDRTEMTPYLLLGTNNYRSALRQASKIMGNRGFDVLESGELGTGERERALKYLEQSFQYCFDFLFPSLKGQLEKLHFLRSSNNKVYETCMKDIEEITSVIDNSDFRNIAIEDPRHLFLMASSRKYPHLFHGYRGKDMIITADWQQAACSILKTAYLIKSIEEDSQDMHDYGQLGLFFQLQGLCLNDLYNYEWHRPQHLPESIPAQRAFAIISTFFMKLKNYIKFDTQQNCLVFNSGDGVNVYISRIESRLKSPESMFTKLGKNIEGEVHHIRDVVALTFILKNMDDTLMLFHALQKRGVILQENTISQTITQTLFNRPEDMTDAVRNLLISLSKSEGNEYTVHNNELVRHAHHFYKALSINAEKNPHSATGHKKFQCKLNISTPIHRNISTNSIVIPGTEDYANRNSIDIKTEQHTLPLELRISDEKSWRQSEQKGDSHHEAYKFRQLLSVTNRLFKSFFHFPESSVAGLRNDQKRLFK